MACKAACLQKRCMTVYAIELVIIVSQSNNHCRVVSIHAILQFHCVEYTMHSTYRMIPSGVAAAAVSGRCRGFILSGSFRSMDVVRADGWRISSTSPCMRALGDSSAYVY